MVKVQGKWKMNILSNFITLDPRLPFPDSEEFFLFQPLLKKSIRVLNGFPAGGATMIVLSMLIRGINSNINR